MGREDASSIKHWPEDERPRERLVKFGGDALSDAQLPAIIIGGAEFYSFADERMI
jgi:DNA repair protein RadC